MKCKYIFVLFFVMLLGCTRQIPTTNEVLPILNISETDYPTRKIDIHDIADVEYIPLETTENSLVGASYTFISDKYIVTTEGFYGGDIYFFDRTGKFLWKFNRKGAGSEEFQRLNLIVVDFNMEECYVNDWHQMLVYSFQGEFKRSIRVGGFRTMDDEMKADFNNYLYFNKLLDYDENYLLGYNETSGFHSRTLTDRHPYYLISKSDGSSYPLDLVISNWISPHIYDEQGERIGSLWRSSLLRNGDELWISEISSDTIYTLRNKELIPVAVQNPSVHSTSPPTTIYPSGFTDYFFVFDVVSLFTDKKNFTRPLAEAKTLVWNRCSNEMESWEIYNSDMSPSKSFLDVPTMDDGGLMMKNYGFFTYGPEGLINRYKKGELKGRLKEIAANLREDDNNVVVLVKYKKEIEWKNLVE